MCSKTRPAGCCWPIFFRSASLPGRIFILAIVPYITVRLLFFLLAPPAPGRRLRTVVRVAGMRPADRDRGLASVRRGRERTGRNVQIDMEEVAWVVLGLELDQPVVVAAKGSAG